MSFGSIIKKLKGLFTSSDSSSPSPNDGMAPASDTGAKSPQTANTGGMTLGSTYGSLIAAGIGAGADIYNTHQTNKTNERIADETNATNKGIADRNLDYQREVLDYNKALQQQIFAREDSAYQRTVADMRAAGLSPLAMRGTNAAGEAIAVDAPQENWQAQGWQAQKADLSSVINGLMNFTLQNESIRRQSLENDLLAQTMDDKVNVSHYESDIKSIDKLLKSYEEADARQKRIYNYMFDLTDDMSEKERISHILANISSGYQYSKGDEFKASTFKSTQGLRESLHKANDVVNQFIEDILKPSKKGSYEPESRSYTEDQSKYRDKVRPFGR